MRELDAVPDEIEIVKDGLYGKNQITGAANPPLSPGGPIPRTVIEKVDPSSTSYGEEPGTPAHESRKADAAPDLILKIPESGSKSPTYFSENSERILVESPIPETLLSRVETLPGHRSPRSLSAHRRSPSDTLPDAIENVSDPPGKTFLYYAISLRFQRDD
jgi:hypothetical protein